MAAVLRLCAVFALVVCLPIYSKDLGKHGYLFEIEEQDFIEYLKGQLAQENAEELQKKIQDSFVETIKEPSAVQGVSETKTQRIFYYDPTMIVREDITDHEDNVIISKGTRVNPLEENIVTQEWLFIDGSNEGHVKWALSRAGSPKIILVAGRPLELEHSLQRPVYFDQLGIISNKLSIVHVPSLVTQEGPRLKIEEVPVDEEGICIN